MELAELKAITPSFSWTAYFQRPRRARGARSRGQRPAARISSQALEPAAEVGAARRLEDLSALAAALGRGARAFDRSSSTRTSTSTSASCRAPRRTSRAGSAASADRRRAWDGAREDVRRRKLSARGEGARRQDGEEPDRRAARRPRRSPGWATRHARPRWRSSTRSPRRSDIRTSGATTRRSRSTGDLRAERAAGDAIRVGAGPGEDRQARRPDGLGHDSADGQRVLQPAR